MSQGARDLRRRSAGRLGDRIASRRADLGLKQDDVAERLRALGNPISSKSISSWEYGRPRIATDQLIALAAALECTVSYLLGLTDDPASWVPEMSMEEATRVKLGGKAPRLLEPIPGEGKRDPRWHPETAPLPLELP